MTGKEAYEKFQSSRQEALRLKIALEEFQRGLEETREREAGELERVQERWLAAYRTYLERRKRPAVELLIRMGNVRGLRLLQREGMLEEKYRKDYQRLAAQEKQVAMQWWLLYGDVETNAEAVEEPILSKTKREVNAEDIWRLVQKQLTVRFPYLSAAFGKLLWKEEEEIRTVGTDGIYFYYSPEWTRKMLGKSFEELSRRYFHSLLHCMYLHLLEREKLSDKARRIRNLSYDIYVEYLLDHQFFIAERTEIRRKIYGELERKKYIWQWKNIEAWMYLEGSEAWPLELLEKEFSLDSHEKWDAKQEENGKIVPAEQRCTNGLSEKRDRGAELADVRRRQELLRRWKESGMAAFSQNQQERKIGAVGGYREEYLTLKKARKYDYRTFLRRFCVFGEEVEPDWEQFDYIPYTYSREYYERLVLLEPLEYKEVYKLQELVIAIDTSGSCRGEIVRQFLTETYQILSERENFFTKMRVHIVQCDSMIQGYACIENEEQWKQYGENPKVQGFGGTDFRPVFAYIEELRKKKVIRNLKGLIYFTDGDGIFPEKPTDYETAFVFLNEDLEKQEVPKWAVKLNLHRKLDVGEDIDR